MPRRCATEVPYGPAGGHPFRDSDLRGCVAGRRAALTGFVSADRQFLSRTDPAAAECHQMDRTGVLSRVELPSRVEAVEVQNRVEHHEVAADRLAAINRIRGKEDDVSLSNGDVDDNGSLRDVGASVEQPRD